MNRIYPQIAQIFADEKVSHPSFFPICAPLRNLRINLFLL
jgi:hypothetical protein